MFPEVMDRLTDKVRQESPRTIIFADSIVICSESRERVEGRVERWKHALEKKEWNQVEAMQNTWE